ncbi:hypothetical protein GCM10027040_16840 [Halomonas shantousis]
MEITQLKRFVQEHDHFEICVISLAESRYYQVELEDVEGRRLLLTQRGKPMLFRTLDDVYGELKCAGINRAYLVQHVAGDEASSREAAYRAPLSSRVPLAF